MIRSLLVSLLLVAACSPSAAPSVSSATDPVVLVKPHPVAADLAAAPVVLEESPQTDEGTVVEAPPQQVQQHRVRNVSPHLRLKFRHSGPR